MRLFRSNIPKRRTNTRPDRASGVLPLRQAVLERLARQRATVRRDTPISCDSRVTRGVVAPCSIAEISTTMVARYTRPPRNRSDGGVAR
jgi:hypothetical protein